MAEVSTLQNQSSIRPKTRVYFTRGLRNRDRIATSILNHTYVPKPIKGVEIPKSNGKTRLLGVPTVVERWLQQAVSQVLMTKFELTFEEYSYGFRPEKNTQKAVSQALKYINDGPDSYREILWT